MRRIFFLLALAACSRSPSEPSGPAEPSPHTPPAATSASPSAFNPPTRGIRPPVRRPGGPAARAPVGRPRWLAAPRAFVADADDGVPHPAHGDDKEDAECSVITFGAGQGGSVDENVKRWVKQLEPTSTAVERSKRTVNGMNVTRVEVAGTYTPMAVPTMPASSSAPGLPARRRHRRVAERPLVLQADRRPTRR